MATLVAKVAAARPKVSNLRILDMERLHHFARVHPSSFLYGEVFVALNGLRAFAALYFVGDQCGSDGKFGGSSLRNYPDRR
jgi:hypothetical protein